MRKKLILLSLLSMSFIGMAKIGLEAQLKFGFDAFRSINNGNLEVVKIDDVKPDMGFNLNLELIPFNVANNRLEFGLGIGYDGGLLRMFPTLKEKNELKKELLMSIPIYGLSKINLVNLENGDSVLHTTLKLGYTVSKSLNSALQVDYSSGLGFGIGIGSEYKNFVGGLTYNGTLFNSEVSGDKKWRIFHRLGLEVGLRLGYESLSVPEIVELEVPEDVKPEVKEKVRVIKNVATGETTEIKLNEYEVTSLPKLLFVKESGYLYSNGDKLYGTNQKTDIKNIFIEENGEILFDNGQPLLLTVFKTQEVDSYKLVKDINGYKLIVKDKDETKELAPEKVAFFPSRCFDNKCVINGYAIDGKTPNADEIKQLQNFVKAINEYAKSAQLEIVGHTDSTGTVSYNKGLGQLRANEMKKILEEYGLKSELKIVNAYSEGELKPFTTNSTPQGRYKNRRVEIIFYNMEKE